MVNVCVIGGGVAGLTCASVLQAGGLSVRVFEAGAFLGGRVRSARDADGRYLGDLGPSWVWPPYQPALASWLDRLGVSTFPQFESGDACIERSPNQPPLRHPLPGQQGQQRPLGGPQAIVDALQASLPAEVIRTSCPVVGVTRGNGYSTIAMDGGEQIEANAVVIATPLRVAIRDITFDPPLPKSVEQACEHAPTWMAAHAKALITYDTPFWRELGLSGRIASTVGPLVEVHDHSGPAGEAAALVGFIGLDAAARERLVAEHGDTDCLTRYARSLCGVSGSKPPRRG